MTDQRAALGPGTIAKCDHELHALDPMGLGGVDRDAALTFVIDWRFGLERITDALADLVDSRNPPAG